MDTLEFNYDSEYPAVPVIWRNKSPQDLYRERYSECVLEKQSTAPKSLVGNVQECDLYFAREKSEHKGCGTVKATLIPIPEKP